MQYRYSRSSALEGSVTYISPVFEINTLGTSSRIKIIMFQSGLTHYKHCLYHVKEAEFGVVTVKKTTGLWADAIMGHDQVSWSQGSQIVGSQLKTNFVFLGSR
jgi:hypothetical protein